MQCTCPECEIWMGEKDKGVFSQCECPNCGLVCSVCLGTNCVMSVDEIRKNAYMWGCENSDEK